MRTKIGLLQLVVIGLTANAAQSQPNLQRPEGVYGTRTAIGGREGAFYYVMNARTHTISPNGTAPSVRFQVPVRTHVVLLDRESRRYELRIMADEVDANSCAGVESQHLFRTHMIDQFSNTHNPRAFAAINGGQWAPSSADGSMENQLAYPLVTTITNYDIRHHRQWSATYRNGEAIMGFAVNRGRVDIQRYSRGPNAACSLGDESCLAQQDFFSPSHRRHHYYAIGSSSSIMKSGVCSDGDLPDGRDAYSAIAYGPRWVALISTDHSLGSGFAKYSELCSLFRAFGLSDGVLMDGGRSSQMFVRRSPSDAGRIVNPNQRIPGYTTGMVPARHVVNAIGVVDVGESTLEQREQVCGDVNDNDGDGLVDCADDDCWDVGSTCRTCSSAGCLPSTLQSGGTEICARVCSGYCDWHAVGTISARYESQMGPPCDAWGAIGRNHESGGSGVASFGGVAYQTYCSNTCGIGVSALALDPCRTTAHHFSADSWRAYVCLLNSAAQAVGPEILGPPVSDVELVSSSAVAWRQRFLRGTLWYGRASDILTSRSELHVHYGPDSATEELAREAMSVLDLERSSSCFRDFVVRNPPSASDCYDECVTGATSIVCETPWSYTYCGIGFDDDPCSERNTAANPVLCDTENTVCIDRVGCVSCGRGEGDICCASDPHCSDGRSCVRGVCTGDPDSADVACANQCSTEDSWECSADRTVEFWCDRDEETGCLAILERTQHECEQYKGCVSPAGCVACGYAGQLCCANDTCAGDRVCLDTGRCSEVCDGDGDGHLQAECVSASESSDCSPHDEDSFPGAPEVCNNRDDDCDTQIDEGCPRHLLFQLDSSTHAECPGGGWILGYDNNGTVESAGQGAALDTWLPPAWATFGTLGLRARCPSLVNGDYYRNWSPWTGDSVASAGVEFLTVDGVDVRSDAMVCNYFPTCPPEQARYWTTPRAPLDPYYNGRTCDDFSETCP